MNNILEINKKEILKRILGDIKRKDSNPKFIEYLRNVLRLKNDSIISSQNQNQTENITQNQNQSQNQYQNQKQVEDVEMKEIFKTAKKEKNKKKKAK